MKSISDDVLYMCKTDYEFELGYAAGGNTLYPSIEDLKKCKPCVESCGIVAVRVEYVETIQNENCDLD